MFGRFYNDFHPGDIYYHSLTKTITESDNNLFCLLTMNHHPIHLNTEYAKSSQHKKILVVGTYVFSLVVGITVSDISGKVIANLEYKNIKHLNPVFIGDTIHARTTFINKRECKKPDRGIVTVFTEAFNQKLDPILSFERSVLVPKKGVHT